MIIASDDGQAKQPLLAQQRRDAQAHQPPPDYHTAIQNQTVPVQHPPRRGENARRRFFRALLVGILVWILLGALFGSLLDMSEIHVSFGHRAEIQPEDGRVLTCMSNDTLGWTTSDEPLPNWRGSLPKYRSTAQVYLPLSDLSKYRVFSRGDTAYGSFAITSYTPGESDDPTKIKVVVQARYYSSRAFSNSDVCILERPDGTLSLGIYTTTFPWTRFPPDLEIEYLAGLLIPESKHQQRQIYSLETDLPHFEHQVSVPAAYIGFGTLSLLGSGGPITVENVGAESLSLKTTDSYIVGNMVAKRSLDIDCSKCVIDTTSVLMSRASYPHVRASIQGWGSLINSRFALQNSGPSLALPIYSINATANNQPLTLSILTAPSDSTLLLNAQTSNAPADITLHPTFEGSLVARTTHAEAMLVHEPASDPSGRMRHRQVSYRALGDVLHGLVQWQGSRAQFSAWGNVDVRTTNANCTIRMPCLNWCRSD